MEIFLGVTRDLGRTFHFQGRRRRLVRMSGEARQPTGRMVPGHVAWDATDPHPVLRTQVSTLDLDQGATLDGAGFGFETEYCRCRAVHQPQNGSPDEEQVSQF
uniref:Uncharacterized protein n=1 Tax=Romanomermis culicivorax TaxID=13658 RepID=A0A915K4F1_ROMCU